MSNLVIEQIPVLTDNYVYLLHDPQVGETAIVDPSISYPVLEVISRKGWKVKYILNTHHHYDHTGGNQEIKEKTGATVIGSSTEVHRIPSLDLSVCEGDTIYIGTHQAIVLEIPGHTIGHIAFWFPEEAVLFPGDTLFSMGCGRLFEGLPSQMWNSLKRLRDLPDCTMVYCAHEYTLSNIKFALTIEPDNPLLQQYLHEVIALRLESSSTIPTLLGKEKAANPFLRADLPSIKAALGLVNTTDSVHVFSEIRRRKDEY